MVFEIAERTYFVSDPLYGAARRVNRTVLRIADPARRQREGSFPARVGAAAEFIDVTFV